MPVKRPGGPLTGRPIQGEDGNWYNVHDEEVVAHRKGLEDRLEELIQDFVRRYKKHVPLFEIEWKKDKKNWRETH